MTHLSSLPFAAATDSTDEKFKHTLLQLAETEPHKNCPGGPRTATTRCQNTTRSRLQSPVLPERLRQRRWILTHPPTHTRTQVRQESEQLLPALKARLGTNEPTFTDVTPSRLSRSLRLLVCPPTCARAAHTLGRQVQGGRDGKERERVPRNRLVVSRGIPSLPSYSGPDAVSAVFKAERETRGRRRIRHGPFSRRNRSRDREGVTARSKRVRVLLVRGGLRGVLAVFANTSDRKLILGRKHQSQRSSREHFYF